MIKVIIKKVHYSLLKSRRIVLKTIRASYSKIYNNKFFFSQSGFCHCCDQKVVFYSFNSWLRDHFVCSNCNSIPRERAIMYIIERVQPNWKLLSIHESSPGNRGASTKLKKFCKNYVASHYFPKQQEGIPIGVFRNENLEEQTFEDEYFDIVVTQDVFEHLYEPEKAFKEIARTLKKGGSHIFTTPLVNKFKKSERWAERGKDGKPRFLKTPEFHGNPINSEGSPVTMHWGYDIVEYIDSLTGMSSSIEHLDNLSLGIRAEYIEVIVSTKN